MFPFEITDVDDDVNRELLSTFTGERTGFCKVGPKGWVLPAAYKQHAEQLYNMPIRENDVWIVTFPRSGTTWCQELVWLLNNKLDYETSSQVSLDRRFPFYEFCLLHHPEFHKELIALNHDDPTVMNTLALWRTPGYDILQNAPSPRHVKTHLPFSLLPEDLTKKAKVLYVARNPKDVAASYFYHNRLLRIHGYTGDFKSYWDLFERDLLVYSPYFEHVKEGWSRKDDPNVLFLFYEDMILDLPSSVKKVAAFLGKPVSDDEVDRLVKHLHIDNFKKAVKVHDDVAIVGITNQDFSSGFFRKGGIGGNSEYDEELSKKVDDYTAKHLVNCTLRFPVKK